MFCAFIFQLVTSLLAVAFARPDIGLKLRQQELLRQQQQQGYNYQPPSTNYGVPNFQQSSSNQFQSSQQIPSGGYIPSAPSSQFLTPQVNFNENTFAGGSFSSLSGFQGLSSQGGNGISSFNSQFGSTASQGSLQQPDIQKHVYFYEAPYEPEETRIQKKIEVPAATKSYKIIFIKAPTQAPPTAPTIPAQPQNEEKTLVYVLVKKPDDQPDIHIPAPIPTQPSKPEVFFIKYKTKEEAKNKIQGTLEGGKSESVSANVVSDGAQFVSSIQDSIINQGQSDGIVSSNIAGQGTSSFTSQSGGTSFTSNLGTQATSSSGSLAIPGQSQYGPPSRSGPY